MSKYTETNRHGIIQYDLNSEIKLSMKGIDIMNMIQLVTTYCALSMFRFVLSI